MDVMGFAGSDRYLASESLKMAVNAAIVLEKPLLIKGEPGTGKTELADAVARHLGTELIAWHIKSTTKAQQDSMNTMRWPGRDSQLGDPRVGRSATTSAVASCGRLHRRPAPGAAHR